MSFSWTACPLEFEAQASERSERMPKGLYILLPNSTKMLSAGHRYLGRQAAFNSMLTTNMECPGVKCMDIEIPQ